MAKRQQKATRLPTGGYAWRGRAVSFSKLPAAERARFRACWAAKGADTRRREERLSEAKRDVRKGPPKRAPREPTARERASRERKAAVAYLNRRAAVTDAPLDATAVVAEAGAKAVLAAAELRRAAHRAYVAQGKHGGGKARKIWEVLRDSLGADLASMVPGLTYYH
jgi:hypothetical protein